MGSSDDRTTTRPRRFYHNPEFNLGTFLTMMMMGVGLVTYLTDIASGQQSFEDLYKSNRAADERYMLAREVDLDRRLDRLERAIERVRTASLSRTRGSSSPFPTAATIDGFSSSLGKEDFDNE